MASSSRQHEKHKTQQTINYNKHHIQGSLTKLYKQDPPDCTLLRHHLGEFATTVTIFELSRSESNADNILILILIMQKRHLTLSRPLQELKY